MWTASRQKELGMTQRDIASSLLVNLSGSGQTAPNYWLNPKTGVSYQLVTQTPYYRLDSIDALKNLPIAGAVRAAGA